MDRARLLAGRAGARQGPRRDHHRVAHGARGRAPRTGTLRLPTWKTVGHAPASRRTFDVHLVLRERDRPAARRRSGRATGSTSTRWSRPGRRRRVVHPARRLALGSVRDARPRVERRGDAAGDSVRFTIERLTTPDLAFARPRRWTQGLGRAAGAPRRRAAELALARAGDQEPDVRRARRGAGHVDATRRPSLAGTVRLASGVERSADDRRRRVHVGQRTARRRSRSTRAPPAGELARPRVVVARRVGGRRARSRTASRRSGRRSTSPGWPKGDLNGAFRYTVDTRTGVSNGSLSARRSTRRSSPAGASTSPTVEAELPARGHAARSTVDAQRRGGTFHLDGTTTPTGWYGHVRGRASCRSTNGPTAAPAGSAACSNTGAGTVDARDGGLSSPATSPDAGTDWLGLHAAEWRLWTA